MTRRNDLYNRSSAGTSAHRQRVLADMCEAHKRGWISIGVSEIPEPPVPCGLPPIDHPRRAEAEELQPGGGVIALPEYGDGEDGGYTVEMTKGAWHPLDDLMRRYGYCDDDDENTQHDRR